MELKDPHFKQNKLSVKNGVAFSDFITLRIDNNKYTRYCCLSDEDALALAKELVRLVKERKDV